MPVETERAATPARPHDPPAPISIVKAIASVRRSYLILAAVLSVASVIPIWAGDVFPTQNGPWYLLVVQMLRQWSNPEFNYAEFYELHLHPIPYLFHTVFVFLVSHVAPILVAHKIGLTIYALLLPLSVFYYLYATRAEHPWLGFTGYLMVYNYCMLRGYQNYAWGIPLVLFALGFWHRHHRHWSAGRIAVQSLLITLVYFCHIVAFAMLGLVFLIELRFVRRHWRRQFPVLLLASTPALLCLGDYILLNLSANVWLDSTDVEWLGPHAAAEMLVRKLFYGYSVTAYYAALVAIVPLTVLVIHSVSSHLESFARGEADDIWMRTRLVLAAVVTALYFMMPYKFYAWHYVDVRLAPWVVVLAMAIIRGPLAAGWRQPYLAAVAGAALFSYGVNTWHVRDLNRDLAEYLSGLEHVPRNAKLLSVIGDDREEGLIRPLNKMYEFYPFYRGGVDGASLAIYNTLTPLWYKHYPVADLYPTIDLDQPPESLDRYAEVYDAAIFWATEVDEDRDEQPGVELRERFQQAGFRETFVNGRLRVFLNDRQPTGAPTGDSQANQQP